MKDRRKSVCFLKMKDDAPEEDAPVEKKPKRSVSNKNFSVYFNDGHPFHKFAHENAPRLNFNQNRSGSIKFLQSEPCNISAPYPVLLGRGRTLLETDICHLRPKQFQISRWKTKSQKTTYKRTMTNKLYRKALKDGVYPSCLFSFAEGLYSIDPHFDSLYDDYYTGGNLCVLRNQKYVMHVNGDNLNNLVCSSITPPTPESKIQLSKVANLTTDGEIFEIQTLNCTDGDSFLVRQKNQITINSMNEDEIEVIHMLTSPKSPFMSSAQDETRRSRLITTDRHQNFKLWNLATASAEKFQFDAKLRPTSSWNMIRFFERDVFLFLTKKNIRRYDTRTHPDESDVFEFGESFEACSRNSYISTSNFSDLFHLATSHKLFTLDSRFLGDEINERNCVLKYTHQMDACPLILRTLDFTDDDSEFIVGASPFRGDMRVFELHKVERKSKNIKEASHYFSSSSLPYMPPSLLKAYNIARRHGIGVSPDYDLKERMSYCLTGMDFYKYADSDPILLTTNSLGDVFSTTFDFKNSEKEDITLPISRYIELLEECKKPKFYATDKADFSWFKKILNCPKLNDGYVKIEQEYDEIEQVVKQKRCGGWRKPTHTLHQYKDVLAQNMLSIWDVPKPDDLIDNSSMNLPQANKTNLVSSWLESTVINNDSMVVIHSAPKNTYNEPTTSTPISAKTKTPKTKKKTKTYVTGF